MLKKTNKLPKSELELEFEMSAEEFNSFFKKALQELSKNLEIKGFRKGNVPEQIAKENIKTEAILSKAAESAAQKEYNQHLEQNTIELLLSKELVLLVENLVFLFLLSHQLFFL